MADGPTRGSSLHDDPGPPAVWLAGVLLLVAFVHRSVLGRFFIADDFLHFFQLANDGFVRFLGTPHGGHLYYARNALWGGLHALFGMEGAPYFAVALGLHLLNVALMFDVARKLGAASSLAALVAACWGTAPVVQGSIAWFSAVGHVMAATCVLFVVRDAIALRRSGRHPGVATFARWIVAMAIASTSYAIGLAVAVGAWVSVPLLLDDPRDRRRSFLVLAGLAPVLLGAQSLAATGGFGGALAAMQSADTGRLFFDLWSHGTSGALLGPWVASSRLSTPLFGPFEGWTPDRTIAVGRGLLVVSLAAIAATGWRADATRARAIAACLVVAAGATLSVAIGRSWLTATFGTPMLASVARYHYIGPAFTLLALAAALAPFTRTAAVRRTAWAALAVVALTTLVHDGRGGYAPERQTFRTDRSDYDEQIRLLQDEIASATPGTVRLVRNRPFRSGQLLAGHERFPGLAAVFVIGFPDDDVAGVRLRFVEPDPEVLAVARANAGTRIAALLVDRETARQIRSGDADAVFAR